MDTTLLAPQKIQDKVKETYAEAAATSKPGLCCPKPMPQDYTSHIPAQAFEHSYGCGSPILNAGVKPGETVVDLGCGVGIDCFVAAKLVGPSGHVIGIDMTDEMLAKAYSLNADVSRNLGYEVVEFRKGRIEQLPLPDNSVDLLVSNCVLNLSTDKERVFKEIFRVLRHGGRMVISDILSDREIRPEDRQDAQAWADCTLGTLSLREFLDAITATGFIGLAQLEEKVWQEIKGYHLSSLTLQAHKFETDSHAAIGHLAIYLGPFAEVSDDLGNTYRRFKPVAIRSDVAQYLQKGSQAASFIVVASKLVAPPRRAEAPRQASSCCGPGNDATPCCDSTGDCGTGPDIAPASSAKTCGCS